MDKDLIERLAVQSGLGFTPAHPSEAGQLHTGIQEDCDCRAQFERFAGSTVYRVERSAFRSLASVWNRSKQPEHSSTLRCSAPLTRTAI